MTIEECLEGSYVENIRICLSISDWFLLQSKLALPRANQSRGGGFHPLPALCKAMSSGVTDGRFPISSLIAIKIISHHIQKAIN